MKSNDEYNANRRRTNPDIFVVINNKLYEKYKTGKLEPYYCYRNKFIISLPEKYKDREISKNGIILHKVYLNTDNPYADGYCKLLNPANYYSLEGEYEYIENEYGTIINYKGFTKTEDEILKLLGEDIHE